MIEWLKRLFGIRQKPKYRDYYNEQNAQGGPRYWPKSKEIINIGFDATDWRLSTLNNACEQWNKTGSPVPFLYPRDIRNLDTLQIAELDIIVEIGPFQEAQASMVGWADVQTSVNGIINKVRILINDKESTFKSRDYIQEILTHELGHALGLRHSSNKNDLMYKDVSAMKPSDADKATLVKMYKERT